MNIITVPFHDWRKIMLEGFRTRDAHFIEELNRRKGIKQVIINRPTTILEILLKRKTGLIKGTVIKRSGPFCLYKISDNLYLIDYISRDLIGQALKGYRWFIDRYGDKKFVDFIASSVTAIGMDHNTKVVYQNIFAARLSTMLQSNFSVFDGWDNFTKFDVYQDLIDDINTCYSQYADSCDTWITNSEDNVDFFYSNYKPDNIELIKNGVALERFASGNNIVKTPDDLQDIPRPIAGFGGKITHLIDVELLNRTMSLTPEVSFVFVGQLLDKGIYDKIDKRKNFYYLGDKHYDVYPRYVKSFDICIVPYIINEDKKSGANTIKVYEYLASGKKVVGTNSNGLERLKDNVYVVNNAEEFSDALGSVINEKEPIDKTSHSWNTKVNTLLKILDQEDVEN